MTAELKLSQIRDALLATKANAVENVERIDRDIKEALQQAKKHDDVETMKAFVDAATRMVADRREFVATFRTVNNLLSLLTP